MNTKNLQFRATKMCKVNYEPFKNSEKNVCDSSKCNLQLKR